MPIRVASAADIPALHALVEGAYRGDSARRGWSHEADLLGGQRTDAQALGEIIADPAQHILVAEEDGAIAGCVQIARAADDVAYLGMLAVDPARQAGGLGRRLISAAEAMAAEAFGARRIEMTVIRQRTELIAYYLRRGYSETGEQRPFPLHDPRFGLPTTLDLAFVVLGKSLAP
jgi:N-acetylglutamate synthase-like GNAT family acetyltransferase